jgi:hypothetical protein
MPQDWDQHDEILSDLVVRLGAASTVAELEAVLLSALANSISNTSPISRVSEWGRWTQAATPHYDLSEK